MNYSELTPYELGETGDIEAIEYLIKYLINGTTNEKRLSASAINKLSKLYKEECNKAKSHLINNLNNEHPQVRQYTLKALLQLDISTDDIGIIKRISESDDKQYNKDLADMILSKNLILRDDSKKINKELFSSMDKIDILEEKNKALNHNEKRFDKIKDVNQQTIKIGVKAYFAKLLKIIKNYPKVFMKFFGNDKNESSHTKDNKINQDKLIKDNLEEDKLMNTNISKNEAVFYGSNIITKDASKHTDSAKINAEVESFKKQYRLFNIDNEEFNQYFNLGYELSEELKEEYTLLADEFINLLNEGLNGIKASQRDINILKMRYNFYWDKRNTLRAIGSEHDICAERVRQIINKTNKKLAYAYKRKINNQLLRLSLIVDYLLRPSEIDFSSRFILFLVYGIQATNTQVLIKMLIELIFGSQHKDGIQKNYTDFIDRLNKELEYNKKMESQNNLFDKRIGNKIQWFNKIVRLCEIDYIYTKPVREVNFDNESYAGDFYSKKMNKKIQYESQLEKEILSILENANKVIFYTVQPFKIPYYYHKERTYIPDIFCVLDDGRGVVIEVKPRFHMALDLNIQKHKALRRYCEKEGYGMLITDSRTSIQELIMYNYNNDFEKELIERLKHSSIKWGELSKLKLKYCIGYRDIASIVLKNNLIYDIDPFTTISMRKI